MDNLPRRPRVLPGLAVLLRRPGELQIGTDPRHAVVIDGLPSAFTDELLALTGRHTVAELGERVEARGENAAELIELLQRLAEAGLLEDSVPTPARLAPDATAWTLRTGRQVHDRADSSIFVHGDGRLAIAVGTLLASSGIGRVEIVAAGTVAPEDTGTGYLDIDVGRPRREAAADALRRACDTVRAPRSTDLVVLADTLVPHPELVTRLMAERVPHLAVRVREGLGVIGPLVLPGRTSCLTCADLHRSDRDECWPAVAAQLLDRAVPADLVTATATAAFAVAQALLALDLVRAGRAHPPTWNATVELDPITGRVEHRSWHPHPNCTCGAHNMAL